MVHWRKATREDLERIWDHNIGENPGDGRYLRWKKQFLTWNQEGQAATFVVLVEGEPVGEVTLEYHSKGVGASKAGERTGYVSALRIRKAYEGQGYVSKLMKTMEAFAKEQGYTHLMIGVEAAESRNLGIYLHWGYEEFVFSEMEAGELLLYYRKKLSQ